MYVISYVFTWKDKTKSLSFTFNNLYNYDYYEMALVKFLENFTDSENLTENLDISSITVNEVEVKELYAL